MKQFIHLLKLDFILLQRYKVIGISIALTIIYIAIFKAISQFGNTDRILILIIFNDPALLGFLFTGVMILFEKNENTLQALAVSPLKERNYMLSKTVSLSTVSLVCCYAMAFAAVGMNFNLIHYFFASLLTTVFFTFSGIIIVSGVDTFNRFLMKAVGFLILLSLPFLGYYELLSRNWFLWMPTQSCIDLYRAAFEENVPVWETVYAYVSISLWVIGSYHFALRLLKKNLN
jgi:fluoroquinolone transport system permease protein